MAKEGDKARVTMAQMIARIWRDPTYREAVKHDPKKALTDAGIPVPANAHVRFFENTETQKYVVLPPQQTFARNPSLLAKLFAHISPIPPGLQVTLVQDTPTTISVVIPRMPGGVGGMLSDEQLAAVAGGQGGSPSGDVVVIIDSQVQAQVQATIVGPVEAVISGTGVVQIYI
jgi:Nitrile hydratase, alpha chain